MLTIKNQQEVDQALEQAEQIAPGLQIYQCIISNRMVTRIEIRIPASESEGADMLSEQGWKEVCVDKMRRKSWRELEGRIKGWQRPDVYVLYRRMSYQFQGSISEYIPAKTFGLE